MAMYVDPAAASIRIPTKKGGAGHAWLSGYRTNWMPFRNASMNSQIEESA
jgi:hypothetical protein